MDDVLNFIKSRRSVRKYIDEKITTEEIRKIIDAARYAPSGGNSQPWSFIVIKDRDKISKIASICEEKANYIIKKLEGAPHLDEIEDYFRYFYFFRNAPVLSVVSMKKKKNPVLNYMTSMLTQDKTNILDCFDNTNIISVSAAIQNFVLAAHSMKIGTCIMTGPLIAENEIIDFLSIKKSYRPIALIPMGKFEQREGPAKKAPARKEIDEILTMIE